MATLRVIDGVKGKTYYLIYSFAEYSNKGKKEFKIKWLKAGKTKAEAEEFQRQFNREYNNNREQFNKHESIKFHDFVNNEFLPWSKAHKAKKTHEMTESALTRFMNYFGNLNIEDITVRKIERYVVWRKEKCSNRTVNIDITYLSQCLKKAMQWQYLKENPVTHVQKLKESSGRVRYFSLEEVRDILANANPYLKRFIMVGLLTGMRHGEILNLKIRQIDMVQNVIHVVNTGEFSTKNRKDRDIPIPTQLKEELESYMATWVDPADLKVYPRTQEQKIYLFCNRIGGKMQSCRKAYDRLLDSLAVEDATIHTMRHTYASHLVMSNVSLRVVQDLLGHHSIKVTEKYAHLSDSYKQQAVLMLGY